MNLNPLCFVLMPFGEKPDPVGGGMIDFDRIYIEALKPAIEDAGMEPIRADEERTGGIIHKPMFERLLLCEFAVADLTTANANVFYELGVRHTARPATTLTIFAQHQPIPFDVNFLRSLPYSLGENNAFCDSEASALRGAVATKLIELRQLTNQQIPVDSPLFDLLKEWQPGDIARLKTDLFRSKVQLNEKYKERMAVIRIKGADKNLRQEAIQDLGAIKSELQPLDAIEVGTAVDLMLSYRALKDWSGMIAVYDGMPEALRRQILVREQLAFAYNRRANDEKRPADREKALKILLEVEKQQGPSSETCGLIGRIHKDNWLDALEAGEAMAAVGHLRLSIKAYERGFMADPRDAYPGINAVTLLDIQGDQQSLEKKTKLLPVVRFAVERRLAGSDPDYWDHATMLELAVLEDQQDEVYVHLENALAIVRELWEPETTANNLGMIQRARVSQGRDTKLLEQVIAALKAKAV